MGHVYIFMTLFLTTYSNLVFKWQVEKAGDIPPDLSSQFGYFWSLFLNLWVISSFAAVFIAAITWVAALNAFELSYAYPFIGISFALVLFASVLFFGESLTVAKVIGVILIGAGVAITARG